MTNTESDSVAGAPQDDDWKKNLPSFLAEPSRTDIVLYVALMVTGVYTLALIPFRAVLLLDHTFFYTVLSGSRLSVLIAGARHADQPIYLGVVVLVAALSTVKFLPLFYAIGRRWGKEFIDMSFPGRPPLWFRKMERIIYDRLGLCLFLSLVPFSPIPATVVVAMGGIAKARPWFVAGCVYVFALLTELLYLFLGLRFGEEVQNSLQIIDRYVMWITVVLVGYLIASVWWKNSRKPR